MLAKAIPDVGTRSPTSVMERYTSLTSSEWSGSSGSRRGSATSSVACRASVIAASLSAAVERQG